MCFNWRGAGEPTSTTALLQVQGSNKGLYLKGIPLSTLCELGCDTIRKTLTMAHRNSVPRACDSNSEWLKVLLEPIA